MREIKTFENLICRHTHLNSEMILMDVESAPSLFEGTMNLEVKERLLEKYGDTPIVDFWYSQNKVWIIIDHKED